jgi:glycosyltransferase involved in cell wall biosynthesis
VSSVVGFPDRPRRLYERINRLESEMTVAIVVFEINEIDGMRAMMPQIKKEWYDELIIVDGGSTDGTIEYAREHGYNLFVQEQKGVGGALNEAVRRVSSDIVIIYAPDGSFLPERIPEIVEQIARGADIVNVTRYGYGARSEDDTFWTATANWLFTRFVNLLFGRWFKFTDFLYTYVGFKRSLVEETQNDTNLITWTQIMMLRAIRMGRTIVEIPGNEPARIGGAVKVAKIKTAFIILRTLLQERFRPVPSPALADVEQT